MTGRPDDAMRTELKIFLMVLALLIAAIITICYIAILDEAPPPKNGTHLDSGNDQ
jgi:hypothetical protein